MQSTVKELKMKMNSIMEENKGSHICQSAATLSSISHSFHMAILEANQPRARKGLQIY